MKKIKNLGSFEQNKKRCNNCKEYFEENNVIEAFHAKEKITLCLDCYRAYGDYVVTVRIKGN